MGTAHISQLTAPDNDSSILRLRMHGDVSGDSMVSERAAEVYKGIVLLTDI